jgi:hypothetical protein
VGKFNGVVSLELRTDNAVRDVTPFFERFTWVESMLAGGFLFTGRLSADQWDDWTPLLLGRDRPDFKFRLVNVEADVTATTDWRTAILDSSASAFQATTLSAEIRGADRRLFMRQKPRTRAWRARTVSEIMRLVASEYGLEPFVADTAARRDWFQLREDDWSFLTRLAARSATASGRGDAFVWVDEDRLRFNAPDLGAPSERRHDLAQVETRADKVVVSYSGREVDRMGGATLLGVGFDFDTARAVTFEVGAAAAASTPSLANKVPRAQVDGLRVLPVTEGSKLLVEEVARGAWGRAAPRYFALRIDTKPDLTLRPGAVIEVQVNIDGKRETPFLGRFGVLEVKHELVGGGLVTTAVCFRREAFEGETEPTGANASAGKTRDGYQAGKPDTPKTVKTATVLD